MKTVVCIIGSTRSGSTMLDLIISSNPKCASLGELTLFEKRQCGFCDSDCHKWEEYKKMVRLPYYYDAAFNVFKKPILVDSSKKWRGLKERVKLEPEYDYKVIHLVRNGLDRLRFRKKFWGKIEPYVIHGWTRTHNKCEKMRKKHNGVLVRYEDLGKINIIKNLCGYIGIDYEPSMRDFWQHEHHGILGSKTAYSLVRAFHGLSENTDSFVLEHGFDLKPRTGHKFLDKKDLQIFERHGGLKLNKELGY